MEPIGVRKHLKGLVHFAVDFIRIYFCSLHFNMVDDEQRLSYELAFTSPNPRPVS